MDELARLVDVLGREAEARQDVLAELGARLRVVLARAARVGPPLADVVQQRREEERPRARDLGGEARRERELVRELAARELPQAIDARPPSERRPCTRGRRRGARARSRARNSGIIARSRPDVVQLAHDRPAARARLGHRADELDEERRGLRAARAAARTTPGSAAARAMASRAKGSTGALVPHARRVDAQRERRIAPAAPRCPRWSRARRRGARPRRGPPSAALRRRRGGRSRSKQALARARDRARVQVVVLHEALGGARAVVAVAHRHGEGLLLLEAEAVRLARRRARAGGCARARGTPRPPPISCASRADEDAEPHELPPRAEPLRRPAARRPRGSARAPPSGCRRGRAGRRRRSSRRARAGTREPPKRSCRAAASSSSRSMKAREVLLGEEALVGARRRGRDASAASPARKRRSSSAVAVARSVCASGDGVGRAQHLVADGQAWRPTAGRAAPRRRPSRASCRATFAAPRRRRRRRRSGARPRRARSSPPPRAPPPCAGSFAGARAPPRKRATEEPVEEARVRPAERRRRPRPRRAARGGRRGGARGRRAGRRPRRSGSRRRWRRGAWTACGLLLTVLRDPV